MNNEDTLHDENVQQAQKKGSAAWKGTVGATVGGAVLGAGVTMTGQAFASPAGEINEEVASAEANAEGVASAEANAEEVVSTEVKAEGVKVAITTDSQSFSEAFAAAREQVGPGGVFEWHGKLYNTYTKEEWDSMSQEQKQEFAEAVKPQVEAMPAQPHHSTAHHVNHNDSHSQANDSNNDSTSTTTTGHTTDNSDIHVIAVQHDVDVNGEQMDVAVISVEGHNGLIFDADQDGIGDVAIIDVNDNGQVEENEIGDISEYGYQMPQQTPGDLYMANADDMPDYVNDAIV